MNVINDVAIPAVEQASREKSCDFFNEKLGARIRAMRKLRGMTQSDLAGQIGVTFQQVQKYERGRNRLSVEMMLRMARILSVAPELLFTGFPEADESLTDSAQGGCSPMQMAEYVHVMELYEAIADSMWRQRACELLRLMGQAKPNAA